MDVSFGWGKRAASPVICVSGIPALLNLVSFSEIEAGVIYVAEASPLFVESTPSTPCFFDTGKDIGNDLSVTRSVDCDRSDSTSWDFFDMRAWRLYTSVSVSAYPASVRTMDLH
jgi:hypothetical protein